MRMEKLVDQSSGSAAQTILQNTCAQAEKNTIESLLNSYLRETGVSDPRAGSQELTRFSPSPLWEISQGQNQIACISLPITRRNLVGFLNYFSPSGFHRYGADFWLEDLTANGTKRAKLKPVMDWQELTALICQELAFFNSEGAERDRDAVAFFKRIINSQEKMAIYARQHHRSAASFFSINGVDCFRLAEQSLLRGHPFHPTPKSVEGFLPEDVEHYAPELQVSFKLHYFAAAPYHVKENFLLSVSEDSLFPQELLDAAMQRLGSHLQHYYLLPCHPWQAEHLKTWPEVRTMLENGTLVDLGPLGDDVFPLSSVRTVWSEKYNYCFKLPINVRITNFVRVNPREQLTRALDASRILLGLRRDIPYANFHILLEQGYRTFVPAKEGAGNRERFIENFAVIFRESPIYDNCQSDIPMVVASLLEFGVADNEAPIITIMRDSAKNRNQPFDAAFIREWLSRYLEISLIPQLWLFLKCGISLEGHVQNSLVSLRKNWPENFFIRDLEGASVSRERGLSIAKQWVGPESPVFYSDDEAWQRFKYYLLVNHVSHVLHTIAYLSGCEESDLWQVVRDVLTSSNLFTREFEKYAQDLFESKTLPAKANLISCFLGRGEKPLYVEIPNTLCQISR